MEGFYVYLSSDASEQLYPGNKKSSFTVNLAERIELDPRLKWTVALTEVILPGDDKTPPGVKTSTTGNHGPIFAYADILRNSRVGDSSSPVLRILSPFSAHQIFVDRYFIPVDGEAIDRISILLSTRGGQRYPLADGNEPVVVVLYFQSSSI